MTVFTITALVCIFGLGWLWLDKKPGLKGSAALIWLALLDKLGAKPRLTAPL